MCGLPAVDPPAYNPLGVLHWDFPGTLREEHHKGRDRCDNHKDEYLQQNPLVVGDKILVFLPNRPGQPGNDPDKDKQRHPVPNASCVNLLAQPHNKHRSSRNGQHGKQPESPPGIDHHRHPGLWRLQALQEEADPK